MTKIVSVISNGTWGCASMPCVGEIGIVSVECDDGCYSKDFSSIVENNVKALPYHEELDDRQWIEECNCTATRIGVMIKNRGTIDKSLWTRYITF